MGACQSYRTALILSSGAMTGAYQCGVLKAFKERGLKFDVVIGSSAGAYNGVRYLADQMDICEEIYVSDLSGRRFINAQNLFIPGRHFLNLDYLVDEVCGKNCKPIDMDKVVSSPSEFFITALELDTLTTRFFDAKKIDLYLLLKATAAIPYLYSGKVMINGRQYVDGGILEPIPVRKAIELGCREICVVLNNALRHKRASYAKRFIGKLPGQIFKLIAEHDRIKEETEQFLYKPHNDIHIGVIRPDKPIPASRFETDGKILKACIDIGYRDGLNFKMSSRHYPRLLTASSPP